MVLRWVPRWDSHWLMSSFAFSRKSWNYKPAMYRRYVVGTSLLFRSKEHVEKFKNYLNKQYKIIVFTYETEKKWFTVISRH